MTTAGETYGRPKVSVGETILPVPDDRLRLAARRTMILSTTSEGTKAMAGPREARSFCRICSGYCGMILDIDEDGRIVSARGDKAHPLTRGYACIKGLQAPEAHNGPSRLRHPLKRL